MKIFDKDTKGGKKPSKTGKASMKDLYAGEKAKEARQPDSSKEKRAVGSRRAFRVLIKPLITERAAAQGALNKYFFNVADDANKVEIKKAVNEVYGIMPLAVNIVNVLGKKTRRGRQIGKRKDWKKAIVTLPEGKTINLYEGV